jgi:hypothetical protein
MARYSAKRRYNLRRQVRLLQEQLGGDLSLQRYESIHDVPRLLQDWEYLWQTRVLAGTTRGRRSGLGPGVEERFNTLARLGLLRSYGLKQGERPIALIVGYHYGPTYLLAKTLHDPGYNAYSPGTTLLHMAIEHLITLKTITRINLCYGNPAHDFRSTNVEIDYASYWLIPRSWKSRLLLAGYSCLRYNIKLAKAAITAITPRRHESATSSGVTE